MLTGTAAYAAHLAGVRGVDLVVETIAAGAIGVLVIGLKYILH
jgi:hypothetical protein